MPASLESPPDDPAALALAAEVARGEAVRQSESRNFLVLAAYQIVLRTGWIFKTESVVVPAALDMLGGASWLRGVLPLLNRFGQSIPPLLYARRLKVLSHKKWSLTTTTLGMATCWLGLAALWWTKGADSSHTAELLFLAGYGCFFVLVGMNQLGLGTLQGKLVRATARGRLLMLANMVGSVIAITAALLLMPRWITASGGRLEYVFSFTGLCFVAAALLGPLLAEPGDNFREASQGLIHPFRSAAAVLRADRNFRRLALAGALFGTSLWLFPHYQALGREKLGMDFSKLVVWVVVQNSGTALFSMLAGPLADRRGNRLVLRLLLLTCSALPAIALLLSELPKIGQGSFWIVFLMIGTTPVTFKVLNNYTLEIAQPDEHPRYLSTLSLSIATPALLSPVAGLMIDLVGFAPVFLTVAGLIACGWVLTLRLEEPRHHALSDGVDIVESGVD